MSQIVSSQSDVQKVLQFYNEGVITTASNFGKSIPDSTTFTAVGKGTTFSYQDEITAEETRNVGSVTRADYVLTGKQGTLSITCQVTNDDDAFVKYLFNALDGTTATADSSLCFLYSYNVDGTETFRTLRGCLPQSATITVNNRGFTELTATFTVFSPDNETQTANAGMGGTPVYANISSNTAWTHSDSGNFTWDSVVYKEKGFSVSVNYEHTILDSSGSTTVQWAKISKKDISGSVSVFKKDLLLQADATAHNKVTASKVLKASQLTATLTEAVFDSHSYSVDGNSSDATLEEMPFTCKEVALAS